MNTAKIDAAVLVMQGLTEAERAVVVYTVEREAGRPGRKRNSRNKNSDSDIPADMREFISVPTTMGLCDRCLMNEHPNKEHADCVCACAA